MAEQTPLRPGEQRLVEWQQSSFVACKRARDQLAHTEHWEGFEELYWGDMWPEKLASYKSPLVLNELKRTILDELSDLTDGKPICYVMHKGTHRRDEKMESAIQAYWNRHHVDLEMMQACLFAMILPAGFVEVAWDPTLQQRQGEIVVRARRPSTVYPDPYARDDEHWTLVHIEDVVDFTYAQALFPDHARELRPDESLSVRVDSHNPILNQTSHHMDTPLYPPGGQYGMTSGYSQARIRLLYTYVMDPATEDVPQPVPGTNGLELMNVKKLRYPEGRLIIGAGNRIVFDDRQPYIDRFPLLRCVLQPTLGHFWPKSSIVSEHAETQKAINKLDSLVVENALRLNKGRIVMDANSGLDPESIGDLPGEVLMITPGANLRIEYPNPMPPDMINAGSRLSQRLRELMGHTPSRAGQTGRGNVSAELTETEISQAQGMTRLRARFLAQLYHRTCEMIFARMAQFYTTPRVIPATVSGQFKPAVWDPILDRQHYVLHLDAETFQVRSKTLLQRLGLALAKMNKLATQDLYSILELPDAEGALERWQKEMGLMAMVKVQQKQAARKR